MAKEMKHSSMYLEQADLEGYENSGIHKNLDDDGRAKRTGMAIQIPEFCLFCYSANVIISIFMGSSSCCFEGTWVTASAHIITAVIGSGVLSLAWAIAQLGWVAGPAILMAFSFITFFTSTLLADSYRSPDPVTGKRNYTYTDAVRANLGENYDTKT